MTEIRSFRRVFDLERRIYRIEGLRLNPSGVPVRGVLYALFLLVAVIAASRAPLLGRVVTVVPWYLRELGFPAGAAAVLAAIRVDGRTFHLAARAHVRLLAGPRRVSGLTRPSAVGSRWRPPDLVLLPDGSDHRLRALRYRGPGEVRGHALRGRVISLDAGATLLVAPVPCERPPVK